ncbi:MAG: hypothetical protein GC178_18370 [Flavobacteriales bacterium]|nr:hypothetical protein [Flavobacteriales bacterium]
MTAIASRTERIDLLNLGLILLALALAYLMPFGSFLVAYAFLGPLHYLTEINWLRDRNYYVSGKTIWLWIVGIVVAVLTVPKVLGFMGLLSSGIPSQMVVHIDRYSNEFLLLSIWSAAILALIKDPVKRTIGLLLGVGIAIASNLFPLQLVLLGALVPTLIHVYLFTLTFMLYGAIKSQSAIGFLSVLLMLLAPAFIALVDVDHSFYAFADQTKENFLASGFHRLSIRVGQLLGLTDSNAFYFYGDWELKLQRFVAFAYMYHYFNWFTKTAIIGWHKGLTGKRAWLILAIWLTFSALFIIDYRLGFYGALALSFMHVVLEFPLNVISAKAIVVWASEKLR